LLILLRFALCDLRYVLVFMLIFLYGQDSYRRQKKSNSFIEGYRQKHSNLSLDYFDLDPSTGSGQEEFFRLKEFGKQMLIFSAIGGSASGGDNKKMAVLKNAFSTDTAAAVKELREFLKKYLNDESLTILISEETIPEELKSLAKKAFLLEKFEPLEGDKWLFFVQKEAQQRKVSLSSQAVYFLARVFKNDGWGLINELDKIALLSKKDSIEPSDLMDIGDYNQESPDIFDFINRVIRNWSLPEKTIALERLFISQEEPVKIFNIMASLKKLPIGLIKKLADYDVMVKSGKIDYEEVLLDLALSG